jgi:hypothetical protein
MLAKQGLKVIALGGLLCTAVLISGCSPEARAKGAAQSFSPTVYSERGFIEFGGGRSGWVDHDKVSETIYEIESRTNWVTPSQQAVDLAMTHAAKVGEANGFTQFRIQKQEVKILCSARDGGAPRVDMTVTYGRADDDLGEKLVFQVSEVLDELWAKVNAKGNSQHGDSQTYLENVGKCNRGRRIS